MDDFFKSAGEFFLMFVGFAIGFAITAKATRFLNKDKTKTTLSEVCIVAICMAIIIQILAALISHYQSLYVTWRSISSSHS